MKVGEVTNWLKSFEPRLVIMERILDMKKRAGCEKRKWKRIGRSSARWVEERAQKKRPKECFESATCKKVKIVENIFFTAVGFQSAR